MLEMFQNQTMRYISIAIGVISIFIFLYLLKLGEGLVISLMVAVFICKHPANTALPSDPISLNLVPT